MKKNWHIADTPDKEALQVYENFGLNKYTGSILYAREIRNNKDIASYLSPELNNFNSPFLMNGITEAVIRIRKALDNEEKIGIFADSDLDGITSLTILYDLLTRCGSTPFIRYPKNKEGYGLTCDIINEFKNSNVKLIITVDSGIRDIDEIAYASQLGIDSIITDHHEPDTVYPDAIIVNPKMPQCKYPFKQLAGVGVVFKLAHAFLFSYTASFNKPFTVINSKHGKFNFIFILNGLVNRIIEIAPDELQNFIRSDISINDHIIYADAESEVLNTILNDIIPSIKTNTLQGIAAKFIDKDYKIPEKTFSALFKKFNISNTLYSKNELIIKLFLELQMRSSRKALDCMQIYVVLATVGTIADIMPICGENRTIIKYGLEVLKNGLGHSGIQQLISSSEPSVKNITWDVAPLLNTPGRLGKTELTVDFFLTEDKEKNRFLIRKIEKLNRERKKIVNSITETIKTEIAAEIEPVNQNIYFYMGDGIISGLAGLIASRIADEIKKPVIIAVAEPGADTVKGSGRSYNDFNFFRFVEPLSDLFERIGGHAQAFGFTAEKSKMEEIIKAIDSAVIYENDNILYVDSRIDIKDINMSLVNELSKLEPFGKNNEEPVFIATGVIIDSFTKFGNSENHGRYVLKNGMHCIGWNLAEKMELHYRKGESVDIVFNIEKNTFMNRTFPRIKIIDLDFNC